MKPFSWRNRRRGFLVAGTTVTAAVAAVAAGLAAPALATPSHPVLRAGAARIVKGPGYPPPGGIYAPFTNCPLNNPTMHEVVGPPSATSNFSAAACVAGDATSGTITLGNITTQVTEPVNVQFGFFTAPGDANSYPAPAPSPLAGNSAIVSTKPDLIPESLTTALGCATATNSTIEHMCKVAQARGGRYNQVYALAEEVGPISDFSLLDWSQSLMFKLINPLLGSYCSIGSQETPVVVNPAISLGSGGKLSVTQDPDPAAHPDTDVLAITGAVASATSFAAPGVIGCGPGGVANGAVDQALDASSGLPATTTGPDTLTLNGNFDVALCEASQDSTLTQPQDDASILLSAFRASRYDGQRASVTHQITMSRLRSILHRG